MKQLSIIGDLFMLPSIIEEKIRDAVSEDLLINTLQQPWPDEPMEHGYSEPGMDGLKEYYGTEKDIVSQIGDAEMLVTHLAPMSASMFDQLPNLRFIAVTRGGPVNIDMQAARDRNVRVVNTPGRNASAVAEFTLGAILAETRLIRSGHDSLQAGVWRGDLYRADSTGRELSELTVGVVGYGHIGTRVVKLLKAFGCRVLVTDPYVQLSVDDVESGVELVSFSTLLEQSDVVTLHARVTEETQHMMNADSFARMKNDAIFINTARGPLADYDALEHALKNDVIASAMLDTFSVEPLAANSSLVALPNVTLTPHIAGASVKTVTHAAERVANEVHRYLSDQPAVNPC